MTIELKIKNKHLAAEAKIIRFEENKLKRKMKKATCSRLEKLEDSVNKLSCHRKAVVRVEQRATYLARAFLRGQSVEKLEKWTHTDPQFARITDMVVKYGPYEIGLNTVELRAKRHKEIIDWYYNRGT